MQEQDGGNTTCQTSAPFYDIKALVKGSIHTPLLLDSMTVVAYINHYPSTLSNHPVKDVTSLGDIFNGVISLQQNNCEQILQEYSFHIRFQGLLFFSLIVLITNNYWANQGWF